MSPLLHRHHHDDERAAEPRAELSGPALRLTVPRFDITFLGVGPDGHIASLFPELPGVRETSRTVVGVRGAPKPPPVRVSLTLPAIRAARATPRCRRSRRKMSAN